MTDALDGALVAGLLARCGLGDLIALEPVSGGTNNRTYLVSASAGGACLRWYYRSPEDPRDRLGAEFGFASFAWDCGIRALPRPLAADPDHALAVYERIEGRRLAAAEVDEARLGEALTFLRALAACRGRPGAAALPMGSEACFSIAAHLATVDRRVQRLVALTARADVDAGFAELVTARLAVRWRAVEADARAAATAAGIDLLQELAPSERCLSPSDFGFHNALLAPDGKLRFIDFEYAGWDDPAKLVNDLFCAPTVPVPPRHYAWFVRELVAGAADPERAARRAALLLPVYQLKWACILLNDFVPEGRQRRRFALRAQEPLRAAAQLDKARAVLARLDHPEE